MSSTDANTTEIERKFLVARDDWRADAGREAGVAIRQGYLARRPNSVVRVRTAGDRAFLTIKGKTAGITRREWEYEIPRAHAEALFALCEGALIEKTRHRVRVDDHVWEVDVFAGANAGLVVAEIELDAEDEGFVRPSWLGIEVTADPRFANAQLSLRPFDAATFDPTTQ